jgi:hypothetical protein
VSEQIGSERSIGDAISKKKRRVGDGRKRTENGDRSGKKIVPLRRKAL